jgi:Uma2 family endonuclease
MDVYAEFGVDEYWILDANAKTLEVFDLTHKRPQLVTALADEAMFRPRLFPNLEIPLKDLWYPEKQDGK